MKYSEKLSLSRPEKLSVENWICKGFIDEVIRACSGEDRNQNKRLRGLDRATGRGRSVAAPCIAPWRHFLLVHSKCL
jgi:hypothetical protein